LLLGRRQKLPQFLVEVVVQFGEIRWASYVFVGRFER
jgi:hypothetical protein